MPFNPRLVRLQTDHDRLTALEKSNQAIKVLEKAGDPPQYYVIQLNCKSVKEIIRNEPVYVRNHQIRISLPVEYPREPPQFQMLTPIWHPNIGYSPNSPTYICIGDEGNHGYAPSMGLDDLVIRILQMLRYQNYGTQHPLNAFAAEWAERHRHLFPLEQ